jgi:excisionase family DNA binding protein
MTTLNLVPRLPARPEPDRAVYSVKEVAQLLGLNLGGTYALVHDGTIPAIRMGGRWLVPKKRFHAWLDGQVEEDAPEPPPPPRRRGPHTTEKPTGRSWR